MFSQVFLDKKDYRKLQILKKIQKGPINGLEIKDLLIDYQCSRKTLHKDLKELNQDLIYVYGEFFLEETLVGTIKVKNIAYFSKQKIILYYTKNSLKFRVFNEIIKQKKTTIKILSEKNYSSQSRIYESLKQFNNSFKSVNLSFSASGIKGSERKIRHLIFEIYWSLFGGNEWPFSINKSDIESKILQLEHADLILDGIGRERLAYWLAVTELRLNNTREMKNDGIKHKKIKLNQIVRSVLNNDEEFELDSEMKEEIDSFHDVLHYFFGYFINFEIEKKKRINSDWTHLEELLLCNGKEIGWNSTKFIHLKMKLIQITYYADSKMLDWYYFIEENSNPYFSDTCSLMDKKIKMTFDKFPIILRNAYLMECRKFNVSIVEPLRINIKSKSGANNQIENILKRYSQYPFIITSNSELNGDLVLTDFLDEYKQGKNKGINCIFFEMPLTENKVKSILNKTAHFNVHKSN